MRRRLVIELCQGLRLEFKILDTPLADLWIERFQAAQVYPLDHPDRFYGFSTPEQEQNRALRHIRSCVEIINSHQTIIQRELRDLNDQDGLNYLHNIFERYHGLLDQQDSDFWKSAPDPVRKALAELNLAVHRVESTIRGNRPRLVCTWFGLPKTKRLDIRLISEHGVLRPQFGTIYLNYVEIGKTLSDLANDNDKYIADEAFKPFDFYSADFVVRFYEPTVNEVQQNLSRIEKYFNEHRGFFYDRGYETWDDMRLLPLFFPVATLIETQPRDDLIAAIAQQQRIEKVFIE